MVIADVGICIRRQRVERAALGLRLVGLRRVGSKLVDIDCVILVASRKAEESYGQDYKQNRSKYNFSVFHCHILLLGFCVSKRILDIGHIALGVFHTEENDG